MYAVLHWLIALTSDLHMLIMCCALVLLWKADDYIVLDN